MSPVEARVEAQAKLNLFLRVLAREASGYHQIETLLCRLALTDTVVVRAIGASRSVRCSGDWIPEGGLGTPEQNLAWRAAAAYADRTGWPSGFEIEIEKRIPIGAGLGGGSADAGAVLRALEAMNPDPVGGDRLLELAGSLGTDVPFLTQDVSPLALAWGRGDRQLALPPLPEREVNLFVPRVSVSTADAYRWVDEHGVTTSPASLALEVLSTWERLAGLAVNDFERPVAARIEAVALLLQARDAAAEERGESGFVHLTGSGSTVYAIQPPEVDGWNRVLWMHGEEGGGPDGVRQLSTRTATFVEPVVLTH